MLDNEFYWRDFIHEINIRLNNLIKQLHLAYEKRNDCIYNIIDNISSYQKVGINISVISDIDNRNKIYFNKKHEAQLGIKLISYIRTYNYLVYEKLEKLDHEIETLAAIKEMPMELYTYIQEALNHEISNSICRGNNYSFGSQVGYIYVYFRKLSPESISKILNWGETMKLKNTLLENGISIKTVDNPNGVPYKIYYEYDWFIHAVYHKTKGRIKQSSYYKFKFGYTPSLYDRRKSRVKVYGKAPKDLAGRTIDEILNDRRLNALNKILAICVNFPNMPTKLYKNNIIDKT